MSNFERPAALQVARSAYGVDQWAAIEQHEVVSGKPYQFNGITETKRNSDSEKKQNDDEKVSGKYSQSRRSDS